MTNEEIIDTTRGTELWQYYGEEINKLLNLARQDEREKWKPYLLDSVLTDAEFKEYTGSEREKMQGVDVWVSVDARREAVVEIHTGRPTHNNEGIYHNHHDDSNHLLKLLKLQKGQCKKVRIVEVLT